MNETGRYKWYILGLLAMTGAFVFAMPMMSMPVLFKEIAEELDLSLVQVGAVWGMIPLAGMFVILLGGLLADRFGAKRLLTVGCFMAGLAGLSRGLANDFVTLVLTMFLFGLVMTITGPGMIKTISTWFAGKRLGLANGVLSTSMAFGFMMGALISATVLSPLLGSWRNVMFLFGGISALVGLLWAFSRSLSEGAETAAVQGAEPFRHAIGALIRNKRVWLLGLVLVGQIAAVQGTLGYLPTYLKDAGWNPAAADGALSTFHAMSMVAAIPITLLSDRLSSRKLVLFATLLATALGIGMLSFTSGWGVWPAVIIAGVVRDGFMAIHITMVIESDGVGAKRAGTAMGVVHTIARLGEFASPPLGNSLAAISPQLPFVMWSGLAAAALMAFIPLREKQRTQAR